MIIYRLNLTSHREVSTKNGMQMRRINHGALRFDSLQQCEIVARQLDDTELSNPNDNSPLQGLTASVECGVRTMGKVCWIDPMDAEQIGKALIEASRSFKAIK